MMLFKNDANEILADDMGLGNHPSNCTSLSFLRDENEWASFGVGSLSTLKNWVSEFKKFAADIPIFLMHDNQKNFP